MKKKVLSIILALALCLSLLPTAVLADSHPVSDHNDWIAWGDGEGQKTSLPATASCYYLTQDVTLSSAWSVPEGTTNLCLNGHVIEFTGGSGSVITVGSSATLNLYDCDTTTGHYFTVNGSGLWTLSDVVTENVVTGGVITGGKGTSLWFTDTVADCGGGVCVADGGTFNMYGGSIVGNTADCGGGVYANLGSTFVMTGGTVTGNVAATNGGGAYVSEESGNACLAAGTMITMANGSQMPVESLEEGDEIRTFDHDTGTVSQAKICFFWHYDQPRTGVFTLHFSNDIAVTVVDGHSFYEREENKYITVDANNAEEYIGHSFYNLDANRWETLESVAFESEPVETYIVATEKHLNCVAEGMLTCEDDIYTALINVFEFDESMKVDAEKKAADIAGWGIWNWDESLGCPEDVFDAHDLQYALIAEGKGLITAEHIREVIAACAPLYEQDAEVEESQPVPMLLSAAQQCADEAGEVYFEASATSVQNDGPMLDPGVYLGGTAKITGNTAGAEGSETTNNLYLPDGVTVTLGEGTGDGKNGVAVPAAGMSVGVTTQSAPAGGTPVQITANGTADDTQFFFADDPDHYAAFEKTAPGYLALKSAGDALAQVVKFMDETPTYYETLDEALAAADDMDTVNLLKDIDSTANITIPGLVLLDLNHHAFKTTGTITNNGSIVLYRENTDIIEDLLINVPGAYGAGEKLDLFHDDPPLVTIPDGAFFTNDISTEDPRYLGLDFVIFDDEQPLEWNTDVSAGVQLSVTYALKLGGDIRSAESSDVKATKVTANQVTLSDHITIGSNNAGDGEAALVIESIHYDEDDLYRKDVIGKFSANGKTITLNKTGKLILSSDVVFDESVLISGVDGLSVLKEVNRAEKTVTYSLGTISTGGSSGSYPVTAESTGNGTFTVDKMSASSGSTVTITVAPDKGFTLETLTVTDRNGREITVKNLGSNKFSFRMPASKVTVEATFMEDNTMLNFCVDVKASDYCYDAVLWAYENEICEGTDYVHFSPNAPVTRGQVVTFLWRAAGKPVVNYAMNMDDVKSGEYYTEAVRWALSEGITRGTDTTTFSPDEVCTRGQIVTLLARFADVEDTDTESVFSDVPATEFFAAAVKWAKDNGVTDGVTETTFAPYADCTRAQVVTFLYRWMVR